MDYTEMDLKWQNMMAGIEAQVPFVRESVRVVHGQVREALANLTLPTRVYLVGCGDSWYCGMATRLAFESWAGIPTEAMQALEFSRYYSTFAPSDALVIAISNSGRVSRTIECVLRARARGIFTIAGTSALDARIAQEANASIDLGYAERRFAPGTSSYVASLVVLYCIALHLARLGGRLSEADIDLELDRIAAEAESMRRTIDAASPVLEQLAARVTLADKMMFVGGGPNYGTAFFSMAKLFEAARVHADGQELEEWAHEQYFITGPDTYTFMISPPGASVDRAREQLWAANQMGSTTVALCDPADVETAALAKVHVPVHSGGDELLSPLSYCIPGELFAFFFAVANNLTMLGFNDAHVKSVNFQQIFNSHILE